MDEPIDLAQKVAEKGNPWFGLGNLLSGTTYSDARTPPVTVESLEAIVKQYPPMDVPLPPCDFANVFNHTFTPELPRSTLTPSLFDEIRWWGLDHKGRAVWILNGKMSLQVMNRLRSKARCIERWQKIRKRQRRAAQRRHNHGKV